MADVFDITPGLIERVDEYYRARCMANASLPRLAKKLEEGKATYDDAYKYAEAIGKARADAFAHEVSSDVLPDGRMYYNIADRLMTETLGTDHEVVAGYAAGVQELINQKNGISLAAQTADLDKDRIKGFIEGVCNAEVFDDVAWKLGEPVVTHARSVVDDTVKKNADFQSKAGIKATVIRNAASKCCEWCSAIDGDYVYPNVPGEVFQRHDNCRCTVDYKGRRLTAYNSGWKANTFRDQGEQERINARIALSDSSSAMKRNSNTSWQGIPQEHTKYEIAELRQFASEKGVVLDPSFESFDGDISLAKDFIRKIDENVNSVQHNRKGKVRLKVSYSLKDDDAYAITTKATITLNGFAYRDRDILEEDYKERVKKHWFTQGSTYLDIATHESAHVLTYLNNLKTANIVEEGLELNRLNADAIIAERISEYATKNQRETVAEAYVAYINGSKEELVLKALRYCGIL